MFQRGAAKLSIDWPSQQTDQGMERNLYDSKRLPSRAPPVKQLSPAVPICFLEMKHFWDKPVSHRVPVKGVSRLGVNNMEEIGMSNATPVELSVTHHYYDLLLCAPSWQQAERERGKNARVSFVELRDKNKTKSCLVPTQEIIYLGLRMNSAHDHLAAFISASVHSLHLQVCLGLPTLLFPCGFHSSACSRSFLAM